MCRFASSAYDLSFSSLPPADAASEPAHLQMKTHHHMYVLQPTHSQQPHAFLHIARLAIMHAPRSHTVGAVTGA